MIESRRWPKTKRRSCQNVLSSGPRWPTMLTRRRQRSTSGVPSPNEKWPRMPHTSDARRLSIPLAPDVRLLRLPGLVVDADENLREDAGQQRLQAAKHQERREQKPAAALADGRRARDERIQHERARNRDAGRDQHETNLAERFERPREVEAREIQRSEEHTS